MDEKIATYNNKQTATDKAICDFLYQTIQNELSIADGKIWHGHPVWFIENNPIVGYSKQKRGIRLMFWSGADFNDEALNVLGGKFKDASIFYNSISEIIPESFSDWLKKSLRIQWDYKNIVKRRGVLERLT
jgi:hypothetical protein